MNLLGWYNLGALVIIFGIFYFVRKISLYGLVCLLTVLAFGVLSFRSLESEQLSEWLVATVGLLLAVFGLMIVRVMLVRSVSLRLLARLQTGGAQAMGEDIEGRLPEMRAFKLISDVPSSCELTPFGQMIGGLMAAFYSLFKIHQ